MLSESSTHHISHHFRISTFRVMVMSPTIFRSPRPFPSKGGEAMAAAAAVVPTTGTVDTATATASVGCSAVSTFRLPVDEFSGSCCCDCCCVCCCCCRRRFDAADAVAVSPRVAYAIVYFWFFGVVLLCLFAFVRRFLLCFTQAAGPLFLPLTSNHSPKHLIGFAALPTLLEGDLFFHE